ncbi:MAG: amylo-alpha-1,6-glucosidase [Calditrichia bacterium]
MRYCPRLTFLVILILIPVSLFALRTALIIPPSIVSSETAAASQWLQSIRADAVVFDRFPAVSELEGVSLVWIHLPDSAAYADWHSEAQARDFLTHYVQSGGNLLLTDYAALLPFDLGFEPERPEIKTLEIEDNWLFDKKGYQSFRGHPVFRDLFGGAFVWDAYQNHRLPTIGYFDDAFPQKGKVVAVEKSYITIHSDRKLLIEHPLNNSRILSLGGFVYFSRENRLQYKLEKLLKNCIGYLQEEEHSTPLTYWHPYQNKPHQFAVYSDPVSSGTEKIIFNDNPDLLLNRQGTDNWYDVSGRRALIMGKEKGGIDELWVHPFRVLRDYRVGMVEADSVTWLDSLSPKIEIRPESFSRLYPLEKGELSEVIVPSLNKAGAVIQYHYSGEAPIQLVVGYRSDLRWMWPYDENAIGNVWYGYDTGLQALHLKDSAEDFCCVIGANRPPIQHKEGQFEAMSWQNNEFSGKPTAANQVYFSGLYELQPGDGGILNFAVVGTNTGRADALKDYHNILSAPVELRQEAAAHYQDLLARTVSVESPEPEFNRLWKWAIIGTDRFMVHTPGVGKALVAGYATTAKGWNGRHEISGRPGYAWYFGRDSEWSGFAIDNYGDVNLVREQLEFLQKFQDLSGKIFHEISTSGVVHYDASDATPLYIILAAHYLRQSGDLDFIRSSWPYLQKALNFLYSTDTDEDGLIENTNVGHGWVEGGKLWGAHTTLYLAALWAQTLNDAAYMAELLNKQELTDKYRKQAQQVRNILNSDFWNEEEQFFYYGKYADGTYNPEKTVLPAVAMYYELLDTKKVAAMLQAYASNSFSADWGVRILTSESPLFNPNGYHYGSVWPLFTGWTSLGEFAYGRAGQGFTHFSNNMNIKNHWALGFVEEVMNGEKYQPSGVCPHQCWSETNILHPAIHGMIGWKPDAPHQSAVLYPQFPQHWDSVTVNNLRAGSSRIQVKMKRTATEESYQIRLLEGDPLQIHFRPAISNGISRAAFLLDNQEISRSGSSTGTDSPEISFQLSGENRITIQQQGIAGMLPVLPDPEIGERSEGYRIISEERTRSTYKVTVEGKTGSSHIFSLRVFSQGIGSIRNGEILESSSPSIVNFRVTFPPADMPFIKQQVILGLK